MFELLQKYNTENPPPSLSELLAEEDRFGEFSAGLNGLLYDYSRVRIDREAKRLLLDLVSECALGTARDRLFRGEHVNQTEDRPALHMLLRGGCGADLEAPADAGRARDAVARMLAMGEDLHSGRLPGSSQTRITDIVHIGIGGSLLGTRLILEALGRHEADVPEVHFLGSVDAHPRERLLAGLDPATTAVVAVSKSFTTGDTLLHTRRALTWLSQHLGEDEARNRLFGVTGAFQRAIDFGVPEDHLLYIPDWVGGRYSLWSPVSLSAVAAMGADAFKALLEGAAAMDRHFAEAAPEHNLPMLMGLVGVWHRNVCGYPCWGVFPYDQRLRLLPAHLQQLIMESNGKSVTVAGEATPWGTSPVVFGESGTEAQHSVFQAMHQGSDVVPVNFVGVICPDHRDHSAHDELLANLLAQAEALASGRSRADTLEQMTRAGVTEAAELLPHRTFEGGRPSEILLLDRLTPRLLGQLLALYEHKVFVESVLWSINAFDQWGVELGKQLAPGVQRALRGEGETATGLKSLIRYLRERAAPG